MPAVSEYPGCSPGVCRQDWASDRVIMVGQAPSRFGSHDPRLALTGRPMDVLLEAAGLSRMEYFWAFERHNLAPEWKGYRGEDSSTGSRFDPSACKASALVLAERADQRRLICWGREVLSAFQGPVAARRADLLTWEKASHSVSGRWDGVPVRAWRSEYLVAVIPHPSGLNRWWNDPENRAAAGRFVRQTIQEVLTKKTEHTHDRARTRSAGNPVAHDDADAVRDGGPGARRVDAVDG